MTKPKTKTITVNGVQIKAVLCYKCGARIFPEGDLSKHIKRHDLNADIYLVGYRRVELMPTSMIRAAKAWEKGW